MWRIVLEFEVRTGQMQRAKSLLYRAIGECPLAKGADDSLTFGTEGLIQIQGSIY